MNNLSQIADLAQIISLPIAVAAILVSIWLFRRSKQRKAISCSYDPIEFPIEVRSGEALGGEIEILYKGKGVSNIFLIRARISSTGNLAIRKSDVVEPITFTFRQQILILREPRIISIKPENLRLQSSTIVETGSAPSKVSLDIDLLNPGDEIVLEFLCAGEAKLPQISARIDGVKKIESSDPEEKRLRNEAFRFLNVLVAVGVVVLVGGMFKVLGVNLESSPIFFWLTIIIITPIMAAIIWLTVISPIIKWSQYIKKNKEVDGS